MIYPFMGSRPICQHFDAVKELNQGLFEYSNSHINSFDMVRNFILSQKSEMVYDTKPCYYIYQLENGYRCQIGVIGLCELNNTSCPIIPHENIRACRGKSYSYFLKSKKTQSNPVMLLHPFLESIQNLLREIVEVFPVDVSMEIHSGCTHKLWVIKDPILVNKIKENYSFIKHYYIADGHHRYYAARENSAEVSNYLLSWAVSYDQANIVPYQWVIPSLKPYNKKKILEIIKDKFSAETGSFSSDLFCHNSARVYINKKWYQFKNTKVKSIPSISILCEQLFREYLDMKKVIRIPITFSELYNIINEFSYEFVICFPNIDISDLLLLIDKGYTLPINTTCFSPKPAIGLINYIPNKILEKQH
jgi:uncharacterized protein (DUF1015 family)